MEKEVSLLRKDDDWSGCFVMMYTEYLRPGEEKEPYIVVEDREDTVLVKPLYKHGITVNGINLKPVHCWAKDWCYVFDKDVSEQIKK